MVDHHRVRPLRLLLSRAAFAIVVATSVPASADISPPAGLEWVREREVIVESVAEFRDWVVLAAPCTGPDYQSYCIVHEATPIYPNGHLYAMLTRDVVVRPSEHDGRTPTIAKPNLGLDAEEFLRKDRRVARSSLHLGSPRLAAAHENSGVSSATYFVRIERITAQGLDARFVRARYRCGDGAYVERDWGPDQSEPPLPGCPARDDQGAVMEPSGAGAGPAGERPSFSPADPAAVRFPYGRGGIFWLGAALASASLLGVGLLLTGRHAPASRRAERR